MYIKYSNILRFSITFFLYLPNMLYLYNCIIVILLQLKMIFINCFESEYCLRLLKIITSAWTKCYCPWDNKTTSKSILFRTQQLIYRKNKTTICIMHNKKRYTNLNEASTAFLSAIAATKPTNYIHNRIVE